MGERKDRRWSALALIVTAQFMVILDVAIVNVALPSIQVDLGFSQTSLQWVISAYAIMFGGTLLLGGRLADLLGRRRLFLAGLALFSVSSLLCGLAWSDESLIAFWAVQGLGGAMLAPAALSLLVTTFVDGRERNTALGIYGAASGSGAAAGVLLGGVLTSYLSWPWIFFINVPVGLAAIALTPWLLRESRAELDHRHFDLPGAATITAGLMLLVYALTRATTDGWGTPTTLSLLATSVGLVLAFVVIKLRSRAPLLPMRIFRLPTLAAGFELVQNTPYGDERWVEVRTPDNGLILVLSPRQDDRPSASEMLPTSNVFFCCDDLAETYKELRSRGVEFPQPPVELSFGWWSIFDDQEGNRFALHPREAT